MWGKLTAAVCANADPDGPDEGKREGKDDDVVCDLILEVQYYEYSSSPEENTRWFERAFAERNP